MLLPTQHSDLNPNTEPFCPSTHHIKPTKTETFDPLLIQPQHLWIRPDIQGTTHTTAQESTAWLQQPCNPARSERVAQPLAHYKPTRNTRANLPFAILKKNHINTRDKLPLTLIRLHEESSFALALPVRDETEGEFARSWKRRIYPLKIAAITNAWEERTRCSVRWGQSTVLLANLCAPVRVAGRDGNRVEYSNYMSVGRDGYQLYLRVEIYICRIWVWISGIKYPSDLLSHI
jgi:hypothetical protein